MTNIKAVDVSEIEKCLKKISDFCPPDNDVNQLDESKDNQARLTLAEVGDTARAGLALIASSPKADGMVLVPSEPTDEMVKAVMQEVKYHYDLGLSVRGDIPCRDLCKAMLSAYKPQADDVRKDAERLDFVLKNQAWVWKTETDTGASAYQLFHSNEDEELICMHSPTLFFTTSRKAIDQAIDKARE